MLSIGDGIAVAGLAISIAMIAGIGVALIFGLFSDR